MLVIFQMSNRSQVSRTSTQTPQLLSWFDENCVVRSSLGVPRIFDWENEPASTCVQSHKELFLGLTYYKHQSDGQYAVCVFGKKYYFANFL